MTKEELADKMSKQSVLQELISRGMNHYQKEAWETAIFPDCLGDYGQSIAYPALGLAGETGEVVELIKKALRDNAGKVDKANLKKELGDVLWYLGAIATQHDLSLGDIASANLQKLADRKERGTIRGKGNSR